MSSAECVFLAGISAFERDGDTVTAVFRRSQLVFGDGGFRPVAGLLFVAVLGDGVFETTDSPWPRGVENINGVGADQVIAGVSVSNYVD